MAPRKPARSRKTALQPIFSWIHLSDVHVGQGSAADQWDQKGMLREVIRDLKKNARMFPQSDAVLVTGDIAFSGDSLRTGETSSRQYTDAAEWLRALGVAVGLEPDRIFVIPGNHDIQRTKKEERQQMRLLRALQNGEDPLDDALRDQTDRMMLTARLGNYLAFARDFAPICLSPTTRPEQWLYWTHALAAGDQYIVRLFGLNSALLCNGDDDARRLFLNKQQLHLLATSDGQPEEIRIVLSHHPFKSDWLRNSDDARDALRGRAHVVLTGHEHQPNVRLVIEPGTKGIIEVFAGAVDPGPDETREYTYNVSTLYAGPADSVRIRIWPRRWLRSAQAYREDWSLVSQGAPFYEQTLPEPIRRGRQPLIPEAPPLSPLSTTPRAEEPAWIVGWGEAQSWLGQMHLIPGRAVLLRGKIALENGCALPGAEASGDDDAWRVAVLDRLVHHAGQRCDGALRPIFLHGLRGIGVTTLLLRYVAAKAPPGSIRLLVDCASNNASPLKDAREALKNRLSREVAKGPVTSLFVAVDGLDLHCRTQAVRDGEPNAALLLEPEAHEFVELVRHESRERQVTLVLTSSDPPSLGHGTDLAALPDWAAPTFLKIVGRLGGIGARLEPSVQDADAEVWSKVLALESATRLPADDRAILQLPLFFDAICGVAPHELRAIETRRDVLSQGLPRARTLGGRQHSYYRALEQLRAFISALEQLPLRLGAQPSEELRQCITLIAAEITGEWMYLLPSSASESPAIRARMRGLRDWLAGDSWRYSDTYALSNLVTALAFLGDRDPVGTNKYRHCNLRNVNIYDPVIANAEFHGVDLSGARVQRGKVSNTKFFGVNLQRAEFSGTRFERAKFVGCSFDAHTFGAATGGGDVLFVEPPEGVMTPTWASNGRSTQ